MCVRACMWFNKLNDVAVSKNVCLCAFVYLQSCVSACIINMYSRFPSTNY